MQLLFQHPPSLAHRPTDRVSSEKGSSSVTPTLSFILGNQFINLLQVQGKGLEETQHPSEAIP